MLFKIKKYDWWLYHFILLWNLCYCEIDAGDIPEDSIHVIYSGIYTPNTDDVALKLYVTILNTQVFALHNIRGEMKKCCIAPLGTVKKVRDCQIMNLLSDERIILNAREQANLTLIYPTLYPFGWNGDCDIVVRYGKKYELQYSLVFQTDSKDDTIMKRMNSFFMKKAPCSSEDQEEMMDCTPVQCETKYSGTRNYFNITDQLCEKPASCYSDRKFPLPTKAFDKRRNQCKDLQSKLRAQDIRTLVESDKPIHKTHKTSFFMYNYICINGKSLPNGRGCLCNEGWMTSPEIYWSYGGPDSRYQLELCSTKKNDVNVSMKYFTKTLVACIIIFLLVIVTATAVFVYCRFCRKQRKKNSKPRQHRIIYSYARVHTPAKPLLCGELDLRIGDYITELEHTNDPGMWKGKCNGIVGIFPVNCAEFFTPNQTSVKNTGY